MVFFFIIQGEGRGHMTQALALEQILMKKGHSVCAMTIGSSQRRAIPDFFKQRTKSNVYPVQSPNFYFDESHKSINLWKTFYKNVFQIPQFFKAIYWIHKLVKKESPDVIINFYDVIGGYYFLLANPNAKRISVAHQYLASHSQFPMAKGSFLQKTAFKLSNFFTSMNSHKKFALSFDELPIEKPDTIVAPPLLRRELKNLRTENEGFILAYVVNKGYGEEILTWHKKNPKVKILCFWDNYEYEDGWQPRENITFKHLNDIAFLNAMANCSGYVSTAGFESICEAAYLKKAVMMVPVEDQYEQACNALDAQRAGLGIQSEVFDLGPFLTFITKKTNDEVFSSWAMKSESIMLKELEAHIPNQAKRRIPYSLKLNKVLNNRSSLRPSYPPAEPDHFLTSK